MNRILVSPQQLDCGNEAGFYIDKVSGGAGECAGKSTGT